MREQLISLAKEKGFISQIWLSGYTKDIFESKNELKTFEDLKYYLWLCELQKWVREKYYIHIYINPYGDCKSWSIPNIGRTDKSERNERLYFESQFKFQGVKFDTFEEALEQGLRKALNLIKL